MAKIANMSQSDFFKQLNTTIDQLVDARLQSHIAELDAKYNEATKKVQSQNDYTSTAAPSEDDMEMTLEEWIAEFEKEDCVSEASQEEFVNKLSLFSMTSQEGNMLDGNLSPRHMTGLAAKKLKLKFSKQ
jgi:hypothetical protein